MDGGALANAGETVVFGAAAVAIWDVTRRVYRNTRGSRSRTALRLNQLACGQPIRYVASLFGPPALFRKLDESVTEYVFYTPHALVQLLADDRGTQRFSITVTDDRFAFRAQDLTFGQADVRLGKSKFWNVSEEQSGRLLEIGARSNYVEAHYFGDPGAYQTYLFAYNDAGVGGFDHGAMQELGVRSLKEGVFAGGESGPRSSSDAGLRSFRSATTINTLTVVGASAGPGLTTLTPHGVDLDYVRVFRPSTSRRRLAAGMTV